MLQNKSRYGKLILAFLVLVEMFCMYWLLFSIWMTAYPFANRVLWRSRVCVWALLSCIVGLSLIATVIRIFRQRRKETHT